MRKYNLKPGKGGVILTLILILLGVQPIISGEIRSYQAAEKRVIIKVAPNKAIGDVIAKIGGSVIDSITGQDTYLVSYKMKKRANQMANSLMGQSGVIASQPNYFIKLPEANQINQSFPDQDKPALDLGISPPDFFGSPSTLSINCDSANMISTGENVIVAVIDNGVEYEHPLFDTLTIENGYDFLNNDSSAAEEPGNVLGHGTFISGIIKRIAPDCQLVPLRAFNANGVGNSFAISQAIYWAINNDVDIINMSFSTFIPDPLIAEAVSYAAGADIVMVGSAGNDSSNYMVFPAGDTAVIAVSAIDEDEYRAGFSNYGNHIDICTPGVNIYSSLAGEYKWGTWSGTSFAAPIIGATCALVMSKMNNATPSQVIDVVKSTARLDLLWGTINPDHPEYGDGCVEAFDAVMAIVKGDVDGSGVLNVADVSYLSNHIYQNGPAPVPIWQVGDINNSNALEPADLTALVNLINQ